jgi:hypothetical protein
MSLPVNYNDLHYTERRVIREEYIKLQCGKCYYCDELLIDKPPDEILHRPIKKYLFPKTFFYYPVHLHHNHITGMTIGAVHNYCNAVLWQYHGE